MFETEPNLWLQSFATPWLTWLMQAVSFFGYDWFYAAAVIGAGFGLRLRPMLGVMLALLLAGLCTHAIKDGLGLPRPVQVDARVLDKGQANEKWQVTRGGATAFLALPSAEAIAAQRTVDDPDYGFISGHVAAATALCAGLWLCFGVRSRRLRLVLLAWPLLMALSRMYLGRHFLGDVLGGALAGIAAAFAANWLWAPRPGRLCALAAIALASCAAAFAFVPLQRVLLGQLLGLALTAAILAQAGFPDDRAAWPARLGRVALAFALYALVHWLVTALTRWGGWPEEHPMSIPLSALATLIVIAGGALLSLRLGLFRNGAAASPPSGAVAGRD